MKAEIVKSGKVQVERRFKGKTTVRTVQVTVKKRRS